MAALDFESAVSLLRRYHVHFPEYGLAKGPAEASRMASKLGFPVALKLLSHDILHKTDIGGVKLGIKDAHDAAKAYSEIAHAVPKSKFDGVLVQKMAPPGNELLVGGKQDVQFGPVIAFGLGGIFVEIFKDVSLRICPIDHAEALDMIHEIRGFPLLAGARNTKPVDLDALAGLLVNISHMLHEHPIKELDLNPVIAYPHGYLAVDVRVLM